MQRQPALDAGEHVLAARHDLEHPAAGQVGLGVLRHPEVRAHQHAVRQRLVHALGRQPDGVALGHPVSPAACATCPVAPFSRRLREPKLSSLTPRRSPGRVGRSSSDGYGPGWQLGHHQVSRPYGAPVASRNATGVPHRRQGRSARPYTQWVCPRRVSPVVTWPGCSRLCFIIRRASRTAPARSTSRTGVHGETPRR